MQPKTKKQNAGNGSLARYGRSQQLAARSVHAFNAVLLLPIVDGASRSILLSSLSGVFPDGILLWFDFGWPIGLGINWCLRHLCSRLDTRCAVAALNEDIVCDSTTAWH